jgi:hypothetical protein
MNNSENGWTVEQSKQPSRVRAFITDALATLTLALIMLTAYVGGLL